MDISGEMDEILDIYGTTDNVFASGKIGWLNALENGVLINSEGGTSGGYAEYVVKRFTTDSKRPLEIKKTIK